MTVARHGPAFTDVPRAGGMIRTVGAARLVGMGQSARRVLPHKPVHRFSDEVGMAGVARVFLDQVD